jgi:hypothetical protein
MIDPKGNPEAFISILAGIGAAIGMGKLLNSTDRITPRIATGRAIVTAGIGAAAGAATLLFPSADPIVLYGLASGLASLGTSGLEVVLNKWTRSPE